MLWVKLVLIYAYYVDYFLFNYISEHIKGYFDRAKSSLLSILTSLEYVKESISKFIREKLKTRIDNATKELIEKTKTANESAEKAREEYKKFLGKGFDSMKELLKGSVEEDVINSLENTKEHDEVITGQSYMKEQRQKQEQQED